MTFFMLLPRKSTHLNVRWDPLADTDLTVVLTAYNDEPSIAMAASNLFEHLSQDELAAVLQQVRTKLKPGGTRNILQPNYHFAYWEYFDDYMQVTVYSERSLSDFLSAQGFRILECRTRFIPLISNSGRSLIGAIIFGQNDIAWTRWVWMRT